jgi:hypothetical protein
MIAVRFKLCLSVLEPSPTEGASGVGIPKNQQLRPDNERSLPCFCESMESIKMLVFTLIEPGRMVCRGVRLLALLVLVAIPSRVHAQVSVSQGVTVLTGHFNPDGGGRADMAIFGQAESPLTMEWGNSDGTFSAVTSSLDPAFLYWISQPGVQLLAAAFHGTGFTDFAAFGGPCPGVLIEAANGDGTFTYRQSGLPQFTAEAALPGSKFVVGVFAGAAYFGGQDIAVLGTDGSLTLSLTNRDGTARQGPVKIALTSVSSC